MKSTTLLQRKKKRKKEKKKSWAAFKVYTCKAYDRMGWNFILSMLKLMGFSPLWIHD